MTLFALLLLTCGLSQREAADFLAERPGVPLRLDTVKSWSSGRNRAPDEAISRLRMLARRIDNEASALVEVYATQGGGAGGVEIGYAADDAEAQSLGWPCAGAQIAALGLAVARLPPGVSVRLRPRGSTIGTAAAADAHGK